MKVWTYCLLSCNQRAPKGRAFTQLQNRLQVAVKWRLPKVASLVLLEVNKPQSNTHKAEPTLQSARALLSRCCESAFHIAICSTHCPENTGADAVFLQSLISHKSVHAAAVKPLFASTKPRRRSLKKPFPETDFKCKLHINCLNIASVRGALWCQFSFVLSLGPQNALKNHKIHTRVRIIGAFIGYLPPICSISLLMGMKNEPVIYHPNSYPNGSNNAICSGEFRSGSRNCHEPPQTAYISGLASERTTKNDNYGGGRNSSIIRPRDAKTKIFEMADAANLAVSSKANLHPCEVLNG